MTVPGEAQGRGFTHGHAKSHSRTGMTVAWLRKRLEESATKCASKIRNLQQALLSAAASVQHESTNEPGEQLGVTGLPPEPFSWQQQKQSRMDGGQEDDGTLRDHVPTHAPLE